MIISWAIPCDLKKTKKKHMKTNNKNTSCFTMVAGAVIFFIFSSINSFAQNTIKTDNANKTNMIPAKGLTSSNSNISNDSLKTKINNNNNKQNLLKIDANTSTQPDVKMNNIDSLNIRKQNDDNSEHVEPGMKEF
jgi:hypothetical protein